MTAQFARAPHQGRSPSGPIVHEPHAALLIDFDNVTMGIRSDLTKELKNLLNSDIIKGKVAVQRAYADWRRYPQYIVPLAESSVDLIFAPAYGSAKKNATDIRLAIDAVELVFTRPEIGTIILLSGDSDFSSLVLKLKEYGKYVIGVGIRESASDLLVQNCDEYYSYSALTGLTRAGDEAPAVSEDPWELVEVALRQMVDNNDVMRSDRLKQVILELDPSFDEKALGFQKFNKFLQEAATRGLLALRKQENGQYEVGPATEESREAAEAFASESREGRGRGRSRRGRGRGREDGRERKEEKRDQLELAGEPEAAAAVVPDAAPAAAAASAAPAPAVEAVSEPEPEAVAEAPEAAAEAAPEAGAAVEPAPERGRSRGRGGRGRAGRSDATPAPTPAEAKAEGGKAGVLASAYELLRRAATDLLKRGGGGARDSDVKRRMLELQSGWDESEAGFSKFSRFLRQAHDDNVVTLQRREDGTFDVFAGNVDVSAASGGERDGGRARDRGRGRDRDRQPMEARTPRAEGATQATDAADVARPAEARREQAARPQGATAEPTAAAPSTAGTAAPPPAALGFRRGSRGRGAPSGPPPLLEGQTAPVSRPVTPPVEAPAAAQEPDRPAPTPPEARGGRKAAKKAVKKAAPAAKQPRSAPAKEAAKKPEPRPRPGFDAAALGLPQTPEGVVSHLAGYKGVGPKSVGQLIEAFGAEGVFEALEKQPDRVRDVLGARGERVLEAWTDDVAFRRANAAESSARKTPAKAAPARKAPSRPGKSAPARGRGGRGGRGGKSGR